MLIFRDFCEFSSTSKTFQLIIFTFLFDFFCSMSLTSPRSLSFSFLFQNKSNQALLWWYDDKEDSECEIGLHK